MTMLRLDCYGAVDEANSVHAYAVAAQPLGITIVPCLAWNEAPSVLTTEVDNYNWAYGVCGGYCEHLEGCLFDLRDNERDLPVL